MTYSPHPLAYLAHQLTRRAASHAMDRMAGALLDARVDLNPHQIDAALFATSNPLSKDTIFADEVGFGKTIDAGITDRLLGIPGSSIPLPRVDSATQLFAVEWKVS